MIGDISVYRHFYFIFFLFIMSNGLIARGFLYSTMPVKPFGLVLVNNRKE